MVRTTFSSHHIAISTGNLQPTERFYGFLGFEPALRWNSADGSLTISHLSHTSGLVLEIFCYDLNSPLPPLDLESGNDLKIRGVKHFGMKVDDLEIARAILTAAGYNELTATKHGRTGIDYFFVKDPNGIWVEIVKDTRNLDPAHLVTINQPADA